MRFLLYIFIVCVISLNAQDKLILSDGTVKKGYILSMGQEMIYFKTSDTSALQKFNKSEMLLIEQNNGTRYVFAPAVVKKSSFPKPSVRRNLLGMQPLGILVGRATVAYERLTKDGKIGFVLPFSLTFDPFGPIFDTGIDTSATAIKRIEGLNFITGADVNFYVGQKEFSRFFIGPRLRYGTDLFLREIEAYTLQTQMGWRFGRSDAPFVQHLSLGFGFVRILSSPAGGLIDPRQSYGWFSFNYRLSFCW